MADVVAATRQRFRDAQARRLAAYAAYPWPSTRWPARAMRALLEVRSGREAAIDNYAARRRARGTYAATLARARSEALTAHFEEIRLWDEFCESIEPSADAGAEARIARSAWINAWYEEAAALNEYCTAQDDARRPWLVGEVVSQLPIGRPSG